MEEGAPRSWWRRPRVIFGLTIGGMLGIWLVFLMWQVMVNMQRLRSGEDDVLTATSKRRFESSVSTLFAHATSVRVSASQLEAGDNPTIGNPAAPVHIVEYVDYGCPYTKKVQPILDDFLTRHADEVYFMVKDFPLTDLHPAALDAALAARCMYIQSPGDRFWRYVHLLYAMQNQQTVATFRQFAQQLGADMKMFDACVQNASVRSVIEQSLDKGIEMGVAGTPTFFFNGVPIQGAIDAESLEVIFSEAKRRALTP